MERSGTGRPGAPEPSLSYEIVIKSWSDSVIKSWRALGDLELLKTQLEEARAAEARAATLAVRARELETDRRKLRDEIATRDAAQRLGRLELRDEIAKCFQRLYRDRPGVDRDDKGASVLSDQDCNKIVVRIQPRSPCCRLAQIMVMSAAP